MVGHASSTYDVRISEDEVVRLYPNGTQSEVSYDVFRKNRNKNTFAYWPLFGWRDPGELPRDEAVRALGIAMMAEQRPFRAGPIPAGYTYLGQFIFHDITYLSADLTRDLRSPALDLDSVLAWDAKPARPAGCASGETLPIGCTMGGWIFAEDLPRTSNPGGADHGKPIIEDPRNDDFLPLAQCHLMLLKFYNMNARRFGESKSAEEIREIWLKHFQYVVLHDFLPRIVGRDVHQEVMQSGRRVVNTPTTSMSGEWMPIEFAVAFGRFGHSMIREGYEPWNDRVYTQVAGVPRFMDLSWHNGAQIKAFGGLSFEWMTNWFHLFDFTEGRYAGAAPPPIYAGRIDTALVPALQNLPQAIRDQPLTGPGTDPVNKTFNLAVATLVRGLQARIATAQQAIAWLKSEAKLAFPELTPDQLVWDEPNAVRQAFIDWPELNTKTPLWYYLLKEADLMSDGHALGPMGARLVMETLHAAIEASNVSILAEPTWRPIWPSARPPDSFTMADLISITGDPNPLDRWPAF